jgi:hypothetical protein
LVFSFSRAADPCGILSLWIAVISSHLTGFSIQGCAPPFILCPLWFCGLQKFVVILAGIEASEILDDKEMIDLRSEAFDHHYSSWIKWSVCLTLQLTYNIFQKVFSWKCIIPL